MKVRYTLKAQSDLDAIYLYVDQYSAEAALTVKDLIERRIAALAQFPLMAPATDEPDVNELSIVRYPYKVYYEVGRDDEVWILHIRHTSRKLWQSSETE